MKSRTFALGVVLVLCSATSLAWNPLIPLNDGALRWPTTGPVVWNPDGGTLGLLSNTDANSLVTDAFNVWQGVSTSVISYSQGSQIENSVGFPVNVNAANYGEVINLNNGQNPIIYDNDREIFDLIGRGSAVLGFAGVLRTDIDGNIVKGYAVIQGDWLDGEPAGTPPSDPGEVTQGEMLGVMVHEFGHFSGLGHTSVNLLPLFGPPRPPGCGAPAVEDIETMGPFFINGIDISTLHNDDEIGISALYPTAAFGSNFTTISGQLIARDGVNPLDGPNLILRPDSTDCSRVYGEAQATQAGVNPGETGGPGTYRFAGLMPNDSYTVEAVTLNDGGAYPIGGTLPPPLEGPDEFWDSNEDHFDPPDDPTVATAIPTGTAGTGVPGIDILVNNAGFPGAVAGDGADALFATTLDGTPMPASPLVIEDGIWDDAVGFPDTTLLAWVNRVTPDDEYPYTLERIDMLFPPFLNVAAGRSIDLLVYTDPTGSGNPANAVLAPGFPLATTVQFLDDTVFNEYVLPSPVTIPAGDFYIGAIDQVADMNTAFLGTYDFSQAGRAFFQGNATTPSGYASWSGGNWMIRGAGSSAPLPGTIELTWGNSCNATTVPGQDFAVYQGTLASLSGVQDHAPIACGTGGIPQLRVPPGPGDLFWLVAPLLADREGSLETGTGGLSRDPMATCGTVDPDPCP